MLKGEKDRSLLPNILRFWTPVYQTKMLLPDHTARN